jgi:hypothetical protein
VLLDWVRFGDQEIRECQVDEAVLELFKIVDILYELINLCSYESSDHGCGCCYSWDYLSSDHLCFVPGSFWDSVILGSKCSTSVNEVYMIVSIVIFFKFSRQELLLFKYLGFKLELAFKLVKVLRFFTLRVRVFVDFHGLFILLFFHLFIFLILFL